MATDPDPHTLERYRASIAAVSSGKEANEEAWMAHWCSSNWAELLQPAPLSIALLGSILCTASGTDDFSLLAPASDGRSKFDWKYMVGDGYTAFETAHKKMQTIQALSEQMPDVIRNLVTVLATGTPMEVEMFFKTGLDDLQSLAQKCEEAAHASVKGFEDLANLSQELSTACTFKAGTAEQDVVANNMRLKVLAEEKKRRDDELEVTKEALEISRKSFEEAQEEFKRAVKSMPSGWSILGMNIVEGLIGVVASAASIAASTAIQPISYAKETLKRHKTPKTADEKVERLLSTLNVPENLIDPGLPQAQLIERYIFALKELLYSSEEGRDSEPNWAKLRTVDGKNDGIYLQYALQNSRSVLDQSKPISASLCKILDLCIPILNDLVARAKSAHIDDTSSIAAYRTTVDKAIAEAERISQIASFAAQMSGTTATGLAYPKTPKISGKASEVAIQAAQHRIELMRTSLTSSRDAFYNVSQQRQQQQSEITNTILELSRLNLANVSVRDIIPILRKSVALFGILRARFSQLAQFFGSITSLITDVMVPSTGRLMESLHHGEKMILSGVSLGVYGPSESCNAHQQGQQYLRAGEYRAHSAGSAKSGEDFTTSGKSCSNEEKAEMLEFSDNTEEGRKVLMSSLAAKQISLQDMATRQSEEILALIERDQQQFRKTVDTRLEKIMNALQTVYPSITSSPPAAIQAVAEAHVREVTETTVNSDDYADAIFTSGTATNLHLECVLPSADMNVTPDLESINSSSD
ncbi:hypothetical protein EW146_g2223 [Bondarzewia mesenterica]|uniref:Uncharacterized protein n=1 Tax=Bondarzewia mesenterica TaxID=1095465 RepID=A0A4S4M181_9AGAM|nr:hypothetical protein EW146_g2223 [Bondarzewia mesenterica]